MKVKNILGIIVMSFVLLLGTQYTVKAEESNVLRVSVPAGTSAKSIQKQLDKAITMEDAGYKKLVVTLERGNYELTKSLVMYSDTTLVAKDCTLIKKHESGPMLRNRLYDKQSKVNYAHDISVVGGVWNAGAGINNDTSCETLRFIHARRVEVNGVTIKNLYSGHMLTLAGVEDATVTNCVFDGYKTYGTIKEALHIDLVHDDTMVPVVKSSESMIIYDDAPCKNITVTNNTFRNVPSGVGSHSSVKGVFNENILVQNNTFKNIETVAVRCYNYKNVTIVGNTMDDVKIGVHLYTSNTRTDLPDGEKTSYHNPLPGTKVTSLPWGNDYNIKIHDNKITLLRKGGEKKFGNAIYVMGSSLRPMSNLSICNNTITNAENHAMYLNYAPNANIVGNLLTNTKSTTYYGGINMLYSNGSTVGQNTIRQAKVGITMSNTSSCYIGQNTLESTRYEAIKLRDYSKYNKVKSNRIHSAGLSAVLLERYSTSNKVQYNNISNISSDAIKILESSKTNVDKNTISSVSGAGVYARKSTNLYIARNKMNKPKYGVYAYSGCKKAQIKNNTINKAKKDGIFLSKADQAVLSSNSITNAKNNGIYLTASKSANIKYNKVYTAKNAGVYVVGNSKSAVVKSNKLKDTRKYGIYIGKGSKVKQYKNTIKGKCKEKVKDYNAKPKKKKK